MEETFFLNGPLTRPSEDLQIVHEKVQAVYPGSYREGSTAHYHWRLPTPDGYELVAEAWIPRRARKDRRWCLRIKQRDE